MCVLSFVNIIILMYVYIVVLNTIECYNYSGGNQQVLRVKGNLDLEIRGIFLDDDTVYVTHNNPNR